MSPDDTRIDALNGSAFAGSEALRQLDVARLLANEPPPIDWLWDGYLERATVCQIHGAGGAGKSLLGLALTRAVVGGVSFLGRATSQSSVVVVDGENPAAEIHRRLSRFEFREVTDRIAYWCADEAVITADDGEVLLSERIRATGAGFCVLDSQRALWHGEENEVQAVRPFYAMLRRVAASTSARSSSCTTTIAVGRTADRATSTPASTAACISSAARTAWSNCATRSFAATSNSRRSTTGSTTRTVYTRSRSSRVGRPGQTCSTLSPSNGRPRPRSRKRPASDATKSSTCCSNSHAQETLSTP